MIFKKINMTHLHLIDLINIKIFFFPFGCVRIGRNVRLEITGKGEINNKSLNFEVFITADYEE